MKKILLSAVALLITLPGFAQWSTSGTHIYNTNSGNVGIGTTGPSSLLTLTSTYATDILINRASAKYARVLFSTAGATKWYVGMDNDATPNTDAFVIESPYATHFAISPNGNTGIGTASPSYKLEVAGGIGTRGIMGNGSTGQYFEVTPYEIASHSNSGWAGTMLGVRSGGLNGSSVPLTQNVTANSSAYQQSWAMTFGTDKGQSNGAAFSVWTGDAATANNPMSELFRINSDGNVAIGTPDAKGYKFAVNGSAIATSMKVKLLANWPDFVFLKDYKLPTLTEVKTYIDKNKHLPDMPSADEVRANGLDLGEMNRLLLKKVEELTLYLIQKDEKDVSQQKEIETLKEQVKDLSKIVSKSTVNN
jgi:hypothetical protein